MRSGKERASRWCLAYPLSPHSPADVWQRCQQRPVRLAPVLVSPDAVSPSLCPSTRSLLQRFGPFVLGVPGHARSRREHADPDRPEGAQGAAAAVGRGGRARAGVGRVRGPGGRRAAPARPLVDGEQGCAFGGRGGLPCDRSPFDSPPSFPFCCVQHFSMWTSKAPLTPLFLCAFQRTLSPLLALQSSAARSPSR